MGREEGGGSGWGTHVYLWQIHFDVWQNQYNTVKFKNKIKFKKRERSFQTPGNTFTAESVASLGTTEGNITRRKNK